MTAGTLRFGEIPKLPEDWQDDPESVWTVWDRDTYYLWGANTGNMDLAPGDPLNGGGMASVGRGPTRGLAHSHYIGIDTMSESGANDAPFAELGAWIDRGNHVVVPTFRGKYSLGTGIGATMAADTWRRIQRSIMESIADLADRAAALDVPAETFWPDCRMEVDVGGQRVSICGHQYSHQLDVHSPGTHPIVDAGSLRSIVGLLTR